jgi:thiol-disulfide isomerase/thioredoxin
VLIALSAIVLSIAVFFGIRTQSQVPSLDTLASDAIPLEVAVSNSNPSLVEFYANWCTSCQSMAPMMAELEAEYGDLLNFVMLNVDNDKWLPELLRYRVDGIPHFVFLDPQGEPLGQTIGEQPRPIMTANLEALLAAEALPYAYNMGQASSIDTFFAPAPNSQTDPRSHSAQSVS